MKNIDLQGTTLLCWQKVWDTQTLEIMKFLWLTIDPETNIIAIDLKTTYKKGVVAFLKYAFPAFMTSPQYKSDRQALTRDLQAAYKSIYDDFEKNVAPKIPYWDMVYDPDRQKVEGTSTPWFPLFKHQKEAVVASHYRKYNFYGMEMRVGKTISSATHTLAIGAKRTVYVCYDVGKFSLMKDLTSPRWNKHKECFDIFDFTILDSTRRKTIHAFNEKFVIVNYEAMEKYLDYLISNGDKTTDHVIFDEAARLKNTSTRGYKNAELLLRDLPNARVTKMTGSPMMNRADDLFAYFKLSHHPLGHKRADFDKLFLIRSAARGKVTGVRNTELLSDILGNFMIRKRLDECVDIPQKAHVKLYYPIGEYKQAYDDAVREALQTTGKVNEQNFSSLTSLMAQAKCPGTIEHIKLLVEQGEKVVVFTSYSKPLDMLCEALRKEDIGYVRVDGKIDGATKTARTEIFNTDPNCMVFLGQMKAAGHSISLWASSNIIILNQPLSAADTLQALSRSSTLTKQKKITVYYPICTTDTGEATIDEVVLDLNMSKYQDMNDVIDKGSNPNLVNNTAEVVYQALIEQYSKETATT